MACPLVGTCPCRATTAAVLVSGSAQFCDRAAIADEDFGAGAGAQGLGKAPGLGGAAPGLSGARHLGPQSKSKTTFRVATDTGKRPASEARQVHRRRNVARTGME
jgi:hypothetical protein